MKNRDDLTEHNLKERVKELIEAYDRVDFYRDLLSHNMNNILNNIKLYAQLCEIWMDNPKESNQMKEMMKNINHQVDRGALLISNVQKLSRVEESEIVVKFIDVKNILKNIIEQVRIRFQEKGINIKLESSQKNFSVKGGDFLIDAFENILINGAAHNGSDTIKINVIISKTQYESDKFVKIEFKDNGIGIVDSQKDAIFKKGHKDYTGGSGMGIGLSLVKAIIKMYNGQIWVENRISGDYRQGSNFVVIIPEVV